MHSNFTLDQLNFQFWVVFVKYKEEIIQISWIEIHPRHTIFFVEIFISLEAGNLKHDKLNKALNVLCKFSEAVMFNRKFNEFPRPRDIIHCTNTQNIHLRPADFFLFFKYMLFCSSKTMNNMSPGSHTLRKQSYYVHATRYWS